MRRRRAAEAPVREDVGHIPRPKEPHKDLAHPHRHRGIPAPLQPDGHPADRVLPDRDDAPVRRQSDRLHSQQGSARGRAQHLLLDPQHLHHHRGVQEEGGLRGALPRRRQLQVVSGQRAEGVQVLPVGLLHALPTGNFIFSIFFYIRFFPVCQIRVKVDELIIRHCALVFTAAN